MPTYTTIKWESIRARAPPSLLLLLQASFLRGYALLINKNYIPIDRDNMTQGSDKSDSSDKSIDAYNNLKPPTLYWYQVFCVCVWSKRTLAWPHAVMRVPGALLHNCLLALQSAQLLHVMYVHDDKICYMCMSQDRFRLPLCLSCKPLAPVTRDKAAYMYACVPRYVSPEFSRQPIQPSK